MVFAKALPFTRITLGKTLTHGPQSIVAASHSWNSSHPLHNRFQKHHAPSLTPFAVTQAKNAKDNGDAAFADYLKKWQLDQKLGANGWRHYQIHKPSEWRTIDNSDEQTTIAVNDGSDDKIVEAKDQVQVSERPATPVLKSAIEPEEIIQSVIVESTYSQQLSILLSNKLYAEIPAVFEILLNSGVKPSANDYNALLTAAIHLPEASKNPIAKALDVYADMLQRNVLPDMKTYTIIIERLAFNALHTDALRADMNAKAVRYQGYLPFSDTPSISNDESLTVAMRLFDAALSLYPQGPFSERTYRLLITACASNSRIPEMVNVYSHMDNQGVVPTADIFVTMIPSFAKAGDIDNSVEMYGEYKKLAVKNNGGELEFTRKDNDIYAALVKAYALSGKPELADIFLSKIEKSTSSHDMFTEVQDTIALRGLVPVWLEKADFEKALSYVKHKLDTEAREIGLAAVCIRAADKNEASYATEAFNSLSENADVIKPAFAMSAMHLRNGDMELANRFLNIVATSPSNLESLELATMHTIALIRNGHSFNGVAGIRNLYATLRQTFHQSDIKVNLSDSINSIMAVIQEQNILLPAPASVELLGAIVENDLSMSQLSAHLLASIGPEDVYQLHPASLELLAQAQSHFLLNAQQFEVGHIARFTHIIDTILMNAIELSPGAKSLIREAIVKSEQPDLIARWESNLYSPSAYSPVTFNSSNFSIFPTSPVQSTAPVPAPEDTFDPYATNTDNKGSVVITDLLEKSYGRFSNHLNEALVRFRNMRRAGKHPRFFTYAKLISAAAKDNRIELAHEILANARQDVPYQAQYRIVRFGWISILDSMVAACLQTGQRHLAEQFHQELRSMGASPSANTFGLYITTLKESTKSFDEASEALKIFLQSKNEGVEPTSFLYNALIGKLGKARRIDDCLFYFHEMRSLAIRPTSVTYGTIVNALCRVSDEKYAEDLFEEMENMPNYKPRPAPYHSMMQFFLTTKRDRTKVLSYYNRMKQLNITPTSHTFKLLIDTHATLDPVDMVTAEALLDQMHSAGVQPDAIHYSSLIHAKGCVAKDMVGAQALFDKVMKEGKIHAQPCLYQALFESMVTNQSISDSEKYVKDMIHRGVELTPYVANALIHGWAISNNIQKAEAIYRQVRQNKREPSTYEAMTRAYMMADQRDQAMVVVNEALSHGYPTAVASKILDLVGNKTA